MMAGQFQAMNFYLDVDFFNAIEARQWAALTHLIESKGNRRAEDVWAIGERHASVTVMKLAGTGLGRVQIWAYNFLFEIPPMSPSLTCKEE
jgi:hypothetical protein